MYSVVFATEALQQLVDLNWYIAGKGFPRTAESYTASIVDYCESLSKFPERGARRDDVLPGLRTVSYKRNVTIAFRIDSAANEVSILGIFSGGQDYTKILEDVGE